MAKPLTAEEITRGRVDRLEICNFKSYGGKTVLGPFLDFTAVVGPNGAGTGDRTPTPSRVAIPKPVPMAAFAPAWPTAR